MATRKTVFSNLLRGLALAGLCVTAPLGATATAQTSEVTLKDLDLLHGLSESGRWYGFGGSGRYFLINADSDTSIYSYFFGPNNTRRTVTADVEILGRTETSSIGLYCCEQEDDSKFLALLLEPDGTIALWEVDPAHGESTTIENYGNAPGDPKQATLSITETADGMVMSVNGSALGTYGDRAIRAGNVGLYIWGQGAFAINSFALGYNLDQPPQEDSSPGFSLFGKAVELEVRAAD